MNRLPAPIPRATAEVGSGERSKKMTSTTNERDALLRALQKDDEAGISGVLTVLRQMPRQDLQDIAVWVCWMIAGDVEAMPDAAQAVLDWSTTMNTMTNELDALALVRAFRRDDDEAKDTAIAVLRQMPREDLQDVALFACSLLASHREEIPDRKLSALACAVLLAEEDDDEG